MGNRYFRGIPAFFPARILTVQNPAAYRQKAVRAIPRHQASRVQYDWYSLRTIDTYRRRNVRPQAISGVNGSDPILDEAPDPNTDVAEQALEAPVMLD